MRWWETAAGDQKEAESPILEASVGSIHTGIGCKRLPRNCKFVQNRETLHKPEGGTGQASEHKLGT